MSQLTPLEALQATVRLAGGVRAVAQDLSISRVAVHKWFRTGRAPAHRVEALHRLGRGLVPREALRPDLPWE